MSLIIVVAKKEISEIILCAAQVRDLFEKAIEHEEQVHFVPMPGKLAEILKLFTENSITYHVTNSAHEIGITDQVI